jgi:hypothetical protein
VCAGLAAAAVSGCQYSGAIPLEDRGGNQWVWPYFAERQPTVLAFWNCEEMRCIEDMPALNALHHRRSGVQLVTVCTGPERMRAEMWLRKQQAEFTVVLDPEEKLARRLGVEHYPTYILLNREGKEVSRYLDIRTVHNWFDQERWMRKASGEEVPPGGGG